MNTTKNIRDYLHFYLGCEGITSDGRHFILTPGNFGLAMNPVYGDFKPFLRLLSDMTEEEKKYLLVNCLNEPHMYASGIFSISKSGYLGISQEGGYVNFCANVTAFHYLLSKHFDLFSLIPDGLAVDKQSLTKTDNNGK